MLEALHSKGHLEGRPAWSLIEHCIVFLTTPVISLGFVYAHILERKSFTQRSLYDVN